MKESLNNLLTRRAVRKYKSDMVPQDVLDRILKAGTYAPSGMGKQSAIIIAITDKTVRDKLSKINAEVAGKDKDPFYGAPVVIAVLADSSIPTYIEDGALVLGNLLNAAHAEGFGSCWVHVNGRPRSREDASLGDAESYLKKLLGIRDGMRILCVIALGYPLEETAE